MLTQCRGAGTTVCGGPLCVYMLCVHVPSCERAWHVWVSRQKHREEEVGETLPSSLSGGQGPVWLLAQGLALERRLQP